MSGVLSGVIIIFILGVLIIAHELGHFWMARMRGVRVLEFAIGMGPVIYKKQKTLPDGTEGTKLTIRALPIGGFCAMEGEDAESDDPKAFPNASKTSRLLILLAGSAMNLLLGLLLAFVLVAPTKYITLSTVAEVHPDSNFADVMPVGFTFTKINGHVILRQADISMFLELGAGRPYEIEGKVDGKPYSISGEFTKVDLGDGYKRFGFSFSYKEAGFGDKVNLAVATAADYCRLVWVSLGELITGRVGVDSLAGPVGMGGMVNEVVTATTVSVFSRVWMILEMMVLITLNLGVFNLLPLPALDGGRIIFIAVEAARRKPVPAKYEGFVHGAGMLLLLGLMVFVFYNDIVRLIKQ